MALLTVDSAEYAPIMESVTAMAQEGYIELPYHNWQHALDTRDEAQRLVGYCQDNGLGLDGFVTEAASLLHDYDYHKHLPASVRSRELRSSRAAGAVLRAHGIDKAQILHVQACIRSTEVGVPCRTDEARAVRRADLKNVGGDYKGFILNTWKLLLEARAMNNAEIPLQTWLNGSRMILGRYINEDVRFEFEKTSGSLDVFKRAAILNLHHMKRESEASIMKQLCDRSKDRAAS